MNPYPIGIVDSGFGGLSIYRSIVSLLPHESTVYLGDHAYLPYGEKTAGEIQSRVKKLITFLLDKKAKLVVVACNTATIAGIDAYRKWFPDVPIVGVVPVIKTAATLTKRNTFAVLSTAFTAKSAYQKRLIHAFAPTNKVYNLGCPNLLSFVEQGITDSKEIDLELRSILTPDIVRDIDIVVLGCTHYPFLETSIRAIVGKQMNVLDSGGAVARQTARIIHNNDIASPVGTPQHIFYSTRRGSDGSRVASTLLGYSVHVAYADI